MSDESAEPNRKSQINRRTDDWENRILCADESCIGVIGPDGRCKECGKLYDQPQGEETRTDPTESEPADEIDEPALPLGDDDWENRTLCADESCIGVIGPDGRCKECGRAYQG